MEKLKHLIRKLVCLCRSPVVVSCLLIRRFRLRIKGVQFGHGLFLEGCVDIAEGRKVRLGNNVRLGKDVYLGAWPDGEIFIGDNSYIGRWTIILAHHSVSIGNDCQIAPGCHIADVNHGIAAGELIRRQPLVSRPVRIGNDVWVETGCSTLPGVTIGDGAVVGARSVVTDDVPANAVVVGVPARILRYRS